MAYQLTSKTTGKVSVITDEQYKNALEVPGFNSLFKAEPILPPAKMVRKKSEAEGPQTEIATDEQAESDTIEQS